MPKYLHRSGLALLLFLAGCACSPDPAPSDAGRLDAPGTDAPTTADGGLDARGDAGECIAVTLENWELNQADDVSVRYRARVRPEIDGDAWDLYVEMLRYGDTEYVGTFPLGGTGPDGNFGTCAHCVIAFYGTTIDRGFLAEAGTLELGVDPFSLDLDATLTGVRLREVTIEGDDLHSVPVPNGRCLDVADTSIERHFAPEGWLCPADDYSDETTCDCRCGIMDPDCFAGLPVAGCEAGERCIYWLGPDGLVPACAEACDRDAPTCDTDTACVDDSFGEVCEIDETRLDLEAAVGATCATPENRWCGITGGVATGMCDVWDRNDQQCRARCEVDDDCDTAAFERCYTIGGDAEGTRFWGLCTPRFPEAWTCGGATFEDGVTCNCGCGAADPDCNDTTLEVVGCDTTESCAEGTTCVPIPENDTCATALPLAVGTTEGSSLGARGDYTFVRDAGACLNVEEDGPDVVYSVSLTAGQTLTVELLAEHNGSLYLLGPGAASICTATPAAACVAGIDVAGGTEVETLTYTATAAGNYYLVVDAFWTGGYGDFELETTITP